MNDKRIALLDTDFTVKAIMSQKDSEHRLLDLLMQYSGYSFACHEKNMEEIKDHDYCDAYNWILEKVKAGTVRVYSDEDIVEMLSSIYGGGAVAFYVDLLKKSCNAFSTKRYKEYILSVDSIEPAIEKKDFIQNIREADNNLGKGKGLGEVKLLILLQALSIVQPGEISVFCSDDGGARNGVFLTTKVHCISVTTLFYHLKNWGLKKDEAEPYYISYEKVLPPNQTTLKIINKTQTNQVDIPLRDVFNNIYAEKYDATGIGKLKEKE